MVFEKYDRIVFPGDSVTDMSSGNPIGEGLFDSLGFGYVQTDWRYVSNYKDGVFAEY